MVMQKYILNIINNSNISCYISNLIGVYGYEYQHTNTAEFAKNPKKYLENTNLIITDNLSFFEKHSEIYTIQYLILIPKGIHIPRVVKSNIHYLEYPAKNIINVIQTILN